MKELSAPYFKTEDFAKTIIGYAGMITAPVFYVTRPEGYGDMGGEKLENIHDLVDLYTGPVGAKNYVQMVAGLTFVTQHVTGKTFLDSFYNLGKAGWQYRPEILSEYEQSAKPQPLENPRYNPRAPLQPNKDMREQMVGAFLMNHEAEIEIPEYTEKLHDLWCWRNRQKQALRVD
jgi:hypothetical protein